MELKPEILPSKLVTELPVLGSRPAAEQLGFLRCWEFFGSQGCGFYLLQRSCWGLPSFCVFVFRSWGFSLVGRACFWSLG